MLTKRSPFSPVCVSVSYGVELSSKCLAFSAIAKFYKSFFSVGVFYAAERRDFVQQFVLIKVCAEKSVVSLCSVAYSIFHPLEKIVGGKFIFTLPRCKPEIESSVDLLASWYKCSEASRSVYCRKMAFPHSMIALLDYSFAISSAHASSLNARRLAVIFSGFPRIWRTTLFVELIIALPKIFSNLVCVNSIEGSFMSAQSPAR